MIKDYISQRTIYQQTKSIIPVEDYNTIITYLADPNNCRRIFENKYMKAIILPHDKIIDTNLTIFYHLQNLLEIDIKRPDNLKECIYVVPKADIHLYKEDPDNENRLLYYKAVYYDTSLVPILDTVKDRHVHLLTGVFNRIKDIYDKEYLIRNYF